MRQRARLSRCCSGTPTLQVETGQHFQYRQPSLLPQIVFVHTASPPEVGGHLLDSGFNGI
jgi:hypothetical protein